MRAAYPFTVAAALLAVAMAAGVTARAETAETDVLTVTLPEVRVAAGGAATFPVTLGIKPEFHTMANPADEEFLIPLTLTHDGADFGLKVTYPEGTDYTLLPGADPIKVYSGEVALRATLSAPASAALGKRTLSLTLGYQACTESACLPEVTVPLELHVEVLPVGTVVAPAAGVIDDAGDEARDARQQLDRAYAQGGIWIVLIVFSFGLLLNLTPCVFPLLPVTMGFFASQGESRPSRTFPMALVYVLSMAAVFTLLGMGAAFAGKQIGAFLQSLAGRVTIAAVLAVLAASLFGAFEIRMPTGFLSRFQGKTGWVGAVLMGLAVGLVAAPCIGPLVSALVAFVADARSVGLGALLFFFLALGLGTPYLVLGVFTGLINKVPRGGGYLVWFRRVLAMPVLALIVYFLRADLPEWLVWTLYAAIGLAGAVYLGLLEGRERRPWSGRFIAARASVAGVFTAAAVGALAFGAAPELGLAGAGRSEPLPWREFRDGDLSRAAIDRAPAVLYVTSKTCSYCWAMDRSVFRGQDVVGAAEGVRLIKLRLDGDLSDEAVALQQEHARAGPPALVFFDPAGKPVARRGKVTRAEFLALLARIKP